MNYTQIITKHIKNILVFSEIKTMMKYHYIHDKIDKVKKIVTRTLW